MKITRRQVLSLPLAVSMTPAVAAASLEEHKDTCLSCFMEDVLPDPLDGSHVPAVYDKDKNQCVFFLNKEGDNISAMMMGDHVVVPETEASDEVLEKAAESMLAWAAQEDERANGHKDTYAQAPRIITLRDGTRLSVGDPEFLGRLVIFPNGKRGLVLHNPTAVRFA